MKTARSKKIPLLAIVWVYGAERLAIFHGDDFLRWAKNPGLDRIAVDRVNRIIKLSGPWPG